MRAPLERLIRAGLGLAGVALGLAIAEWALRARGQIYDAVRTHPDPELLYTLKPGLRGRVLGTAHAYNSRGIRDREFSPSPAPGTLRLLCVGDSIAYAQVTPLEKTFVKQLESSLRSGGVAGWSGVEATNAGVAGYNACPSVIG